MSVMKMNGLGVGLVFLMACGAAETRSEHGHDHAHDHVPHESGDHGDHAHGNADGHHHDFSDVDRYAARFDAPEREAWQRPDEVVALLNIAPHMTIADIGAGTGYFLSRLSAAASEGRVLALDVEPAMVEHMRTRAAAESLQNVEAREITPSDPALPAGATDRVLIVNTWHHIGAREEYAATLRDALTDMGELMIVDFDHDAPFGPPPAARIPPEQVIGELTAGGLVATTIPEDLPHQYIVVARKGLGLRNERWTEERITVSGQPDAAALRGLQDAGTTHVISLRRPNEPGFDEERASVEELGMRFVSIPVDGEAGLTRENARLLHEAMTEPGQTALHCGSGNRAGALLALRAFLFRSATVDDAVEEGRRAGLTRMTDAVRNVLEGWSQQAP